MSIKLKEVLEKEFKRRKLSINHVANECNIPISVLHGWVKDGVIPSGKNLIHIKSLSEFLGIPVDYMLFENSDEKPSHLILFSSTFRDGNTQYKLTIEKVKEPK
jgi:predicted Holliday junction resolvase-like endonuclease